MFLLLFVLTSAYYCTPLVEACHGLFNMYTSTKMDHCFALFKTRP